MQNPSLDDAMSAIMAVFKTHNRRANEVLHIRTFLFAMEPKFKVQEIADGLEGLETKGWIRMKSSMMVQLTDIGFANM